MENKFKWNYVVIPAISFVTWMIGRFYTYKGLDWYRANVKLPFFAPSEWMSIFMWGSIFVLTTIAALFVWNTFERGFRFWLIIGLFITNALLNIIFCYLFFNKHMIGATAVLDAAFLTLNVYLLVFLTWPKSRVVSWLLMPYAVWVTFATAVSIGIWIIN